MSEAGPRTGGGDPARTLALLWRRGTGEPRRGPARGLSIDAIVDAAIALADAEGLDTLTMRRVAQTLGVAPMTLYTYVPGKAELLDLMLDALYARSGEDTPPQAPRKPRATARNGAWRARLAAIAQQNRALFAAHPWAATISTVRPPLGPGLLAKYERELRAFEGLGLTDVEMDAALTFLLAFVRSSALADAAARAARGSQPDDTQWWEASAPLLAELADADAYPTATRVGTAAGAAYGAAYDPDYAYRFGLERVLDGLAALIARRSPGSRSGG
ncbi:MAG TPA: TetR/AcrR family transcriptional regulator C-terminal domain-containing protein [Chloroflexota bacterium]|nr:TetR/AcrR family transcriptional regulator C-terminal domain-containing protein [Chloroflexota bacterium]